MCLLSSQATSPIEVTSRLSSNYWVSDPVSDLDAVTDRICGCFS